ncbi:BURP domain-containing protein 1-like [Prosopis cineraria]|uniref:BURP domain-containing protein 1-like n=1 Tax=Prosopis cineraria TaxID=364024 RepID=UPI00240F843E|nr:BURP domain-containing protein 1-like [Prosopis cineraria]
MEGCMGREEELLEERVKNMMYAEVSGCVALLLATHAALPPELYWKSMFPTTPIPKSLAHLLPLMSGYGTTIHGGTEYRLEDRSCFDYCYKNNGKKLDDNANTALFFLEEDLKAGHKMNLLFKQASNQASFLPREIVKSIPFSSNKWSPHIINRYRWSKELTPEHYSLNVHYSYFSLRSICYAP